MHSIAAVLQVIISKPGPDPILDIKTTEGKVKQTCR